LKLKKFVQKFVKCPSGRGKLAFSVSFSIISNKPTTTTEEFNAFHGFMLIKI